MASRRKFHQEQFLGASRQYKVKTSKSPIRVTDSATVNCRLWNGYGEGAENWNASTREHHYSFINQMWDASLLFNGFSFSQKKIIICLSGYAGSPWLRIGFLWLQWVENAFSKMGFLFDDLGALTSHVPWDWIPHPLCSMSVVRTVLLNESVHTWICCMEAVRLASTLLSSCLQFFHIPPQGDGS